MSYSLQQAVRDAASNRRPEDVLAARHKVRIARRRALGYRDVSVPLTDLERLIEAAAASKPTASA
jgi:hypothetical protein